jgi:hypothetical protein
MRRGEGSTATFMPESKNGPPHRENVIPLAQARHPLPTLCRPPEPLDLRMQVPAPRWPLPGLISLVLGLTLYLLPSALVVLALAVRRLDFSILILDLFQWVVPLIVICPVVGVWMGFLAVLRSRKAASTPWHRRLSVVALAFNTVNWILVFVLWWKLL